MEQSTAYVRFAILAMKCLLGELRTLIQKKKRTMIKVANNLIRKNTGCLLKIRKKSAKKIFKSKQSQRSLNHIPTCAARNSR